MHTDFWKNKPTGDGTSSFTKKTNGKETSQSTKSGTKSASPQEVDSLMKEEEELISRCDSALNELETGLEKKSLPFFVRPLAKQLITNLKSIRSKAENRLSELRNPEAKPNPSEVRTEVKSDKNAEIGEGKAKGESTSGEATAKKVGASEATAKKAGESGKTGEKVKEGESTERLNSGSSKPEDVMSEFMKSFKNMTGKNNVCLWKENDL